VSTTPTRDTSYPTCGDPSRLPWHFFTCMSHQLLCAENDSGYCVDMAMGTRKQRQRQEELWYRGDLVEAPGHPFYRRLNEVLDQAGFDEFCEAHCCQFYHEKLGRPSLAPGMYFRVMLIGFFEGIESERGIAWRMADSLCLRQFLQIGLDERTPDHVTISRTRRLMDVDTHQEVFGCECRVPQ